MKKLSLFFLLYTSLLFSQEKPVLSTEEAVGAGEEESATSEQGLGREDVVVEGRDENLFRGRKKDTLDVPLSRDRDDTWKKDDEEIISRAREGEKADEKKAQALSYYGSYHTFGNDISVAQRDDQGTYLLHYRGEKYDSEGKGEEQTYNSLRREDSLMALAGFDILPGYNLLLKARYRDVYTGLQENPVYAEMFRRGAFLDLLQQWNLSERRRLHLGVSGEYVGATLRKTNLNERENSDWKKAGVSTQYDHIFSGNNALSLSGNLWYGEKTLLDETSEYYRVGNVKVEDLFPLFSMVQGENGTPWEVDIRLGAGALFAQGIQPIFLPVFAVESYYGAWTSVVLVERNAEYLSEEQYFVESDYVEPQVYSLLDYWHAGWRNSYGLTRDLDIIANVGLRYYNSYPEKIQNSTTELYLYRETEVSTPYVTTGIEQDIAEGVFYQVELNAFFPSEDLENHPNYAGLVGLNLERGGWRLGSDFTYYAETDDNGVTIDYRPLWNASLDRRIAKSLSFYFRTENILHQEVRETSLYERSGFKAMGGIRLLQ